MRCEADDLPVYFVVGAFALDNVVNFFQPVPVFVASIPFSMLLMFRVTRDQSSRLWLIACMLCLMGSVLVNSLRFDMSVDDVSDVLFIAQFFSSYFYARHARVSPAAISVATYVFALLFLPALVGINASGFTEDIDVFNSGSTDIEFLRLYNQGLYRIPHVASYLLAFGALWWVYVASCSRKSRHLIVAFAFLLMTLYTGSRTPILVIGGAFLVANIRLRAREISVMLLIAGIGGLFFLYIKEVLALLYGTYLYQYLSFFETVSDNADRLSRVIIWDSWLSAVSSFSALDLMVGRLFSSSFEYNLREIGLYIWFHNDFLSMFYSYGVFVLFAYALPHMIAIKRAVQIGSSSRLLSVVGLFIVAAAFVNGFYKYLPVMFFVLLFMDKADVAAYARGERSANDTAFNGNEHAVVTR
jgi:hypothetical protein